MPAMNKPIRWGILGTGLIAAEFAKAMHHVRDAELLSGLTHAIECQGLW